MKRASPKSAIRSFLRRDDAEFFAGIDENGLGPVLGPMVVTGVLARVTDEKARVAVQKKPPKSLRVRLGDSKDLVDHKDDVLGEAWAQALTGGVAKNADELIDALTLEGRAAWKTRCPSHHDDHCWAHRNEPLVAPKELVDAVTKDLATLRALGIEIASVRSVTLCNRMLNEAAAKGISRFTADLHAMEKLVLHFREVAGKRVSATCGKVGGFDFYDDVFGPLSGHLRTTLAESRRISAYEFPGTARMSFVMDADAHHLLVSMASLVGKWLRDALMRKIVAYYKHGDDTLPDASGYHDPVTRRFIAATSLVRARRRVEDACFIRDRLGKQASNSAEAKSVAAKNANAGVKKKSLQASRPKQEELL